MYFSRNSPESLEVVAAQASDPFKPLRKLLIVPADAHPDSAAAGGALEHHGITDFGSGPFRRLNLIQKSAPGDKRNTPAFRKFPRLVLEPEVDELLRRRADEFDPVPGAERAKRRFRSENRNRGESPALRYGGRRQESPPHSSSSPRPMRGRPAPPQSACRTWAAVASGSE